MRNTADDSPFRSTASRRLPRVLHLEDPSADLSQASAWWRQVPAEYQSVAAEAFHDISRKSEDTERTRSFARALGLPIGLAKDPPM